MTFHDIILPDFIAAFAVAQPHFKNSCITTKSGIEVRHLDDEHAKYKYIIKNCILNKIEFEQFHSFFKARRGQSYAFRFRDYTDFQVIRQNIAEGDDTSKQFQLFKLYKDPILPYIRQITKPVNNTVKLYINDEPIQPDKIDCQKGIVYLVDPLPIGKFLIADFNFDVVVRFCDDNFSYRISNDNNAIILDTLELIEVRET